MGPEAQPATVAAIVARADGNPFYLEELVRAAREGRADGLPDSILGMVHARLDAEGDVAKQILRAASIFGERFSRRGLAALLGGRGGAGPPERVGGPAGGARADRGHVAGPGLGGRAVLHARLIRDAAYATLTEEDSVLGHQLAGDYLEQVGCPDAMVLAQHFRRGNQPVRAVRWYREAAEQALRASDLPGAIGRAQIGLATIAALDPVTGGRRWRPTRRGPCGWPRPRRTCGGRSSARRWRGAAEATGALRPRAAPLVPGAGADGGGGGQAGQGGGAGAAGPGCALETECDPDAGNAQVICLAWAATFLLVADRPREADQMLGRLGEMVKQLADPDAQALALLHQAQAARASVRGDQAACLASLEAALAAFDMAGDVRNVSTVRSNIGFVVAELGVWERAETVLRDALADAQRMGLAELEAVVQHNLGRVLAIRGDLTAGEQLERQAIESFARQGEPRLEGLARTYLAEIRLWAGQPADAETHATQAVEVLKSSPAPRVQALAVRAAAALAQARNEDALDDRGEGQPGAGRPGLDRRRARRPCAWCTPSAWRPWAARPRRWRSSTWPAATARARRRHRRLGPAQAVPVRRPGSRPRPAAGHHLDRGHGDPPRPSVRPGDRAGTGVPGRRTNLAARRRGWQGPAAVVATVVDAGTAAPEPRQLPGASLVVRGGIGVLLAAANVYAGLKTGFIDGGSITATLLGSALLGLSGGGRPRRSS